MIPGEDGAAKGAGLAQALLALKVLK
jgi:hypothetical protein